MKASARCMGAKERMSEAKNAGREGWSCRWKKE